MTTILFTFLELFAICQRNFFRKDWLLKNAGGTGIRGQDQIWGDDVLGIRQFSSTTSSLPDKSLLKDTL